ncbi:MAG TPA: hypothetical protein DCM54_16825 [Gammaproteobacteria bacterium]|nr:hypothetical protein [Gammaproteobacteria bacterium]
MNPSPHYRWYIVALTLINQSFTVGILVYSFALFVVPWLETFSISRGQVMVTIFLTQTINGFLSPVIGRFLDHSSIRNMVVAGAVCMSVGMILASLSGSFWQIILIQATLLPLALVLCGTLSSQTLVGKWFTERRGIAIGISAAGTSIGGFVFPFITAQLIGDLDWRTAFQILGVLTFVVLVPLNLLVLRVSPPSAEVGSSESPDLDQRIWNTREILTTKMFWIPIAGLLPHNLAFSAVQFNLGAYVSDLGMTQGIAAQIISLSAFSMILGKFLFGGLGDYVDHRFLFWGMALSLCGALMLYSGAPSRVDLYIAAIMQGVATGGVMPMMGNVYASRFGTMSFGRVLGMVTLFTMLGSSGSLLSGWMFDLTQTYDYVFWFLIVFQIPCVVIMYWLPPPARN